MNMKAESRIRLPRVCATCVGRGCDAVSNIPNEQLLDLGRYCTPRKINEQILLYTFFSFSFIHLHRNKFNPQLFARDRRLRALSSGLRRI
jgi:hypothetical protein